MAASGDFSRRREKSSWCTDSVSSGSSAAIVALRVASSSSSASSPNISPGPSTAAITDSPRPASRRTATRPLRIRCSVSAGSPWWNTTSPEPKLRRRAMSSTSRTWRSSHVGEQGPLHIRADTILPAMPNINVTARAGDPAETDADTRVVPLFEGEDAADAAVQSLVDAGEAKPGAGQAGGDPRGRRPRA